MKFFTLALIFFAGIFTLYSQDSDQPFIHNLAGGIEFQAYPTGLVPSIILYKAIDENNFAHVRFGFNYVRHGDAGLNQDERGEGWGGSIGYDRLIMIRKLNWLVGVRVDLWQNNLDWKNNINLPSEVSGSTRVTVLQPTFRLSYPLRLNQSFFLPSLAIGSEINVNTQGEDVGEGLILLLGISYVID